ncbi:MAG: hypothetical protein HC845_09925 [Akkermansiaceae bacterium]|nr:hypothetical protein [Akkermansiaceae bacterium]
MDGFFGLCCLGFEEVERDEPQGGEVLRGPAFLPGVLRIGGGLEESPDIGMKLALVVSYFQM